MKAYLQIFTTILLFLSSLFTDSATLNAQLVYEWANAFVPGTAGVACQSTVVDSSGNVYVTGNFESTVDFDPSPATVNLTSSGYSDVFLAKYNSVGNLLWAFKLGGTELDYGYSVTLDSTENIIVTGSFRGTVDFDPSINTSNLTILTSWDVFIAKYSSSGNYIWVKSIGGFGNDEGWSIKTDTSKNIYITGIYSQTMDLNPGAGAADITSVGINDCFVVKYDSSGNYIWGFGLGSTLDEIHGAIAVNLSGQVYVTGAFRNTVDFDPAAPAVNLTSAGILDIFIAKYNASGNYLWAHNIGSTESDLPSDIKTDVWGNIFVTGSFQLTCDFNPSATTSNLASNGVADIFLAKYNASGNYQWAIGMGGVSNDYSYAVALDAYGKIYIGGSFSTSMDFDPGAGTASLTTFGGTDGFVARYSDNGSFIDRYQLGGPGDDITASIAIGSSAPLSFFSGGYFNGSGDFDPSPNQAILNGVTGQNGYLSAYHDATNTINELMSANELISIYPNPSNGNLSIEVKKYTDWNVYNSVGELVTTLKLHEGVNQISLSNIADGIYFMVLSSHEETNASVKFMITR